VWTQEESGSSGNREKLWGAAGGEGSAKQRGESLKKRNPLHEKRVEKKREKKGSQDQSGRGRDEKWASL